MDKGIHIGNKDSFLDRFIQNRAELRLLSRGDGTEVMLQKIDANEAVIIDPGDYVELMEFFYILSGELELEYDDTKIFFEEWRLLLYPSSNGAYSIQNSC